MAVERFANDFETSLAAAATSGAATITVASVAPASLQAGQFRIRIDNEILLVTGGQDTTTWNVSRGQEGTTAAGHANTSEVAHIFTSGGFLGKVSEMLAAIDLSLYALKSGATFTGDIQVYGHDIFAADSASYTTYAGVTRTGSLQTHAFTIDPISGGGGTFGGGPYRVGAGNPRVSLGSLGPSSAGAVAFGLDDTALYRSAAGVLTVTGMGAAAGTTLVAKSVAAQTANLQEWQTSAGVALNFVKSTGAQEINPQTQGTTSLILRNFGTTNPLSWGDNGTSGTIRGRVTQNGALYIFPGPNGVDVPAQDATIFASPRAVGVPGVVIRGLVSQTADLQQWQDSSGTVLTKIDSTGGLSVSGTGVNTFLNGLRLRGTDTSNTIYQQTSDLGITAATGWIRFNLGSTTTLTLSPTLGSVFTSYAAGITNLVSKGVGAAATVTNKALTSNVATLTTSAAHGFAIGRNVVVAGVDATFNGTYVIVSVPTSTTFTYSKVNADVTSTAATGTATSMTQTANVQEWQDSTGAAVAWVTPEGVVNAKVSQGDAFVARRMSDNAVVGRIDYSGVFQGFKINVAQAQAQNYSGVNNYKTKLEFDSIPYTVGARIAPAVDDHPATPVLAVQGGASQTGNLQEWRDSTNAIRASFAADGSLSITGAQANSWSPFLTMESRIATGLAQFVNVTSGALAGLSFGGHAATPISHRFLGGGNSSSPVNVRLENGYPGQVGLVVRAYASQSGNLSEWQDSASVVIAKVTPTGRMQASGFDVGTAGAIDAIAGSLLNATSATFMADYDMIARRASGTSGKVEIGQFGPASESGIRLGGDTVLYRPAAGIFANPTAGGGFRLKSPDGLTTKTLSIDNSGALVVA